MCNNEVQLKNTKTYIPPAYETWPKNKNKSQTRTRHALLNLTKRRGRGIARG